jgi:beta-N-acetylhexosaminidase
MRLALAALAAFVLGAVIGAGADETTPTPRAAATPTSTPDPVERARAAVDRLSLEQQVGHMVILRFAGTTAPGYVRRALREGRAAGVILFADNVISPVQLRTLTQQLKAPIVSVDQEGGEVRNLPWAPPQASAPDQAAAGTVESDSRAAGAALRRAGVTVTLAPVADVPTVGGAALASRAFSSDPDAAAEAVTESIRGWHEGGVATTVKHFPGLGGATVNTDDGPSTIARTRSELEADLVPFRAAYVMAGHATYPALDGLHIASQSPTIIDGLLRRELGFKGVVMTDSLEAAAVRDVTDVEEAAVASAAAGVDVILTTGRGSYIRVYRALLARAKADREFRARVRDSAARVLAAQSSRDG